MSTNSTQDDPLAFLASFLPSEAQHVPNPLITGPQAEHLKAEINEVYRRLTVPPDQFLEEFSEIDQPNSDLQNDPAK